MTDGPRWQTLAWLVAAALVGVMAVRWFDREPPSGGEPVVVSDAGAAQRGKADNAAGGRGAAGELYVHAAGAVKRPGLYRVPRGSRVAAAIDRAGGLTRRADATAVNLAALVEDGQQVIVPLRAPAPAAAPSTAAAARGTAAAPGSPAGAAISLSRATQQELETLDGIGPALAARIIQYRDSHGGFRSVDELLEVDGIGDKRMEALRAAVRP